MTNSVGDKISVYVWHMDARINGKTVMRQIRLYKGRKCIIYQKKYVPLSFHRVGGPSACLYDAIGDVQ